MYLFLLFANNMSEYDEYTRMRSQHDNKLQIPYNVQSRISCIFYILVNVNENRIIETQHRLVTYVFTV